MALLCFNIVRGSIVASTVNTVSECNGANNYIAVSPADYSTFLSSSTAVTAQAFTLSNAQDLLTAIIPLLVLAFVFRAVRRSIFPTF